MHKYHVTIFILSIVTAVIFYLVISNVPPTVNGEVHVVSLILAALPLIATLTGLLGLVSYAVRHTKNPFKQHRQQTRSALLQGLRLSIGIVVIGVLAVTNLLNIVSLLLTIALIITIESMM